MTERGFEIRDVAALLLIAVLTCAVFGQTAGFDFIHYDDGAMVYENPHVLDGPTWANIRWAFSNAVLGIWMPITVLSYQLDSLLFGHWPGGYHLSNTVIHTIDALLLYVVLRLMVGSRWRSLFVALVFAIHPLRAESVAWVAERKDVLCGLFWLLSMLAYWRYTRKPGVLRYAMVFVLAALALMSKSMAVTLFFTLLLLDWWPLERLGHESAWRQTGERACRLILEKVPLLAMSMGTSWIAFQTQAAARAVESLERISLELRLENAVVAYWRYLGHFFVPVRLSVFYPYREHGYAAWVVAVSCLALASVTLVALVFYRRRYLAVGWFWFLGTLIPVIGLVQVGAAAVADRYTYIPGIGIAIVIAWAWPDTRTRRNALLTRGLAGMAVAALAVLAWRETGFYRDTETLFRRAMAVTEGNYIAYRKIADLLVERGQIEEAVRLYRKTQRLYPGDVKSNYNLGSALIQLERYDEAAAFLGAAVRRDPEHGLARSNLGVALTQMGRHQEALPHLSEAVRLDPQDVNARINYGVGLLRTGRPSEAAAQFEKALELRPGDAIAKSNLDLAQKQSAGH